LVQGALQGESFRMNPHPELPAGRGLGNPRPTLVFTIISANFNNKTKVSLKGVPEILRTVFALRISFVVNLIVFIVFILYQTNFSNAASKCNAFSQQSNTALTLPGIASPHFVPGAPGTFFTTITDPNTQKTYVVYCDEKGIIDSTQILYIETGGDPAHNSVAEIEVNQKTFIVFGADKTIYIRGPNNEDVIAPTTFNFEGRIWTTPILSAINNDKEFYIIVMTDDEYHEDQQSKHDTYAYTFIYNTETNTIKFASSNQPIFKIVKASLGQNNPALCGNTLFFTVTYNDVNYSEMYAVDITTGKVKDGWPQPVGETMTTGPAAVQEADSVIEVAAGAFQYVSVDTNQIVSRIFSFFKADGTQPWRAFLTPGFVASAPNYTEVNNDRSPEVLFTVSQNYSVTLYILDGKTKELIAQKYLGNYPVLQITTVDLNADGLIEIMYRTRTDKIIGGQYYIENKVIVLHLDKEGRIVDSETEELLLKPNLPFRPYGPLSVIDGMLYVGGNYTLSDSVNHAFTDIYRIPLGPLSTKGTWPVAVGQNLQNTGCLIIPGEPILPQQLTLGQNYPNPFGEETRIPFALRKPSYVRIVIYNLLGQKVHTLNEGELKAGEHYVEWDGTNNQGKAVASGIYFYYLFANKTTQVKKMMLIRYS